MTGTYVTGGSPSDTWGQLTGDAARKISFAYVLDELVDPDKRLAVDPERLARVITRRR